MDRIVNFAKAMAGRKPVLIDRVPKTRDGAAVQIGRARDVIDEVMAPRNRVHAQIIRADGTVEDLGWSENLRTNVGRDWQCDVMGNATQPASARHIALTTNATAPAATDTALTGEITTGGLARVAGTYAHTVGAQTYTITASWTASAAHTAVAKAGLFNAASGGTMAFETLLNATATLAINDTLQVTWTVDLGTNT